VVRDNYRNLDLNLLKIFSITYQERNLKRAAARLFVSAPAVSQSLKRLKEHLGNELFVKTPKGFDTTPYADSLYIGIQPLLDGLSDVVNLAEDFCPSQIQDTVTFDLGQHLIPWLSPILFREIYNQCPNGAFASYNFAANTLESLRSGKVDMAIEIQLHEQPKDIIAIPLGELIFSVIMRKNHPFQSDHATLEQLIKYDFALVELPLVNEFQESKFEKVLKQRGLQASIKCRSDSVIGIKEILEHSDLISPVLLNFARRFSRDMRAVKVTDLDELRQFPICAYIHERNRDSLKHQWLVNIVKEAITQ
jgi:DNA-binding transcriptional LysR family regulator